MKEYTHSFLQADNDNRRFLSFIQHCKKQNDERKNVTDEMMTPSGDYVILEAKEMLKHFNEDGLPKRSKNLVSLKPSNKKCLIHDNVTENQLKFKLDWPNILLTKFHDIYYNNTENSEKIDATNAKIQQMYVGSRETASTCHVFNSNQTVVHTKPNFSSNDNVHENLATNQPELRRTPRKSATGRRPFSTAFSSKSEPKVTKPHLQSSKDPQMIFK